MTADLVAFLHARFDEDEQIAREAQGHVVTAVASEADRYLRHWRSARVLAGVQAKRQIVALHTGHHECVAWQRHSTELVPDPNSFGRSTATVLVASGYIHENDPTLRLLASAYADHGDYQPEWAPDV